MSTPFSLFVVRMCRDILNSCVRNTEEAEKISRATSQTGEGGRGVGKGIWGMIEESKLAKTIRKGDKEMVRCHFRRNESNLKAGIRR